MKRKTINAIISKRIKAWLESIDDYKLRNQCEQNVIVTGGCIASMLLGEQVRDFDVYFRDKETVRQICSYYVKKFKEGRAKDSKRNIFWKEDEDTGRVRIMVKSAGVASERDDNLGYDYFETRPPEEAQAYVDEVFTDPGEIEELYEQTEQKALEAEDNFRPVFLSTNSITLAGRVQLIIRFYGTPEEIHENYDFQHCTNYWTKEEGVVLNLPACESLLTKELRYVGSKYPLCSLIRTRKFVARGWTINAGQFLKMAMQVSDLDLNDIATLEDQLTGVDVAYFQEVIERMKDKDKDRVDQAYLLEILDRMF